MVSGTETPIAGQSGTLTAGVAYTMVVTTKGASCSVTLNGQTIISGATIPTGTATILLIGQSGGNAGDVVFTDVKVTSN